MKTPRIALTLLSAFGCAALVSCSGSVAEAPRAAAERARPGAYASMTPAAEPRRSDDGIPTAERPLPPSGTPATPVAEAAAAAEPDPDAERRKLIVGTWTQQNTGTRTLTIRPDGTATMVIDPDWTARLVIGDKLTVQIKWTAENDRVLFKSVSGKPESAFKAVTALYGNDRDRALTELTATKFALKDDQDGSVSEWTRVPDAAAKTASAKPGTAAVK